ncbi:MAG: class I SAM-dependent methyltransferase [Chloroflexi bacterium]|nr:class I SAM-dependent methyltransferase [Chloroflexota bacterium]
MNERTIEWLNQINQEFYRITAGSFDESRGRPWPGWDALLPHLPASLSVLDVGCGNGRFGLFLAQHLGAERVTYTGIDSSPELLARARTALHGLNARLEARDLLREALPDGAPYDLVALFGVLHHIPGYTQRIALLRDLAQRVRPDGLLAFSAWRFYEYPRFRERIVPWPDDLQAEAGDFLLDWRRGERAIRYCHYVDDAEYVALVRATGLTEIASYRADGRSGDLNRYSLLRRETV